MATYVVGDIHGCFDEWMELKNRIEKLDNGAIFILTGDIIDRGPKPKEMIDWALENIGKSNKYFMIRGNHEDMKLSWLRNYSLIGTDREHKYKNTKYYKCFLDRYDLVNRLSKLEVTDDYLITFLNFVGNLPLIIELNIDTVFGNTQKYYIVHAAIPLNFIDQDLLSNTFYSEKLMWDRNYFGYRDIDGIVVHGHTPTLSTDLTVRGAIAGLIDFKQNDINVDCGCVFSGYPDNNLAAIRLEDLEEFYLYEYKNNSLRHDSFNLRDKFKADLLNKLKNNSLRHDSFNLRDKFKADLLNKLKNK